MVSRIGTQGCAGFLLQNWLSNVYNKYMNIFNTKSPHTAVTPRDFFLNMGVALSLYVWSFAFLMLAFAIIDEWFPDVVYGGNPDSIMAGTVGVLIVVVPLFIWLIRMVKGDLEQNPELKNVWVRTWSIGLTLFISAVAFTISLIRVVVLFVSGALTLPTVLKMVLVLVFAGCIFYFFRKEYKNDMSARTHTYIEVGVGVVALALILLSFAVFGGPATQRDLRLDQERVNNLQSIQWQIVEFYQNNEALPEHLSDIEDPLRGFSLPLDPETNEPYNYQVYPETLSFELCATFNRESKARDARTLEQYPSYGIVDGNFWEHTAGYQCFNRTIDIKLLSPNPPVIKR